MLEQPLPVEFKSAIGDMAAGFDHASVGRDIALNAVKAIPMFSDQLDNELLERTVLAATSNVVAIIDGLMNGLEASQIPVPSVSQAWVDLLVARNIDTAAIPWAYSFGSGRMADALRAAVGRLDLSGEERWDLGDGLTKYVRTYVENICAQLVTQHTVTYDRYHSGLEAYRRTVIQKILSGEAVDVTSTSRELGYELNGHHMAVIVWPASEEIEQRPTAEVLRSCAGALLSGHGASAVFSVTNPDGSAWAWGHGDGLTDLPKERVLDEPGLLAAVGTVSEGLRGFIASHGDAQRAKRVATLLGKRARSVIPYRSVALTSMVAQDPQQALRFVESELGSLLAETDSARRLRATLAVYLDEGMRPVRTARRLGIHQNTVAYRITQAEEAIGRSASVRRLELETALRLADALESLRFSAGSARA